MSRRLRRGFTLIELLVVIAIIAILAAILFPVFARARESGKRAKCISNLKQLIVSLHMYADDHKDRYPPTEVQNWPFGDWNDGRATMGLREFNAYVKDTRVFFCPSNRFFKPSVYWKHNAWWCGYCYWGNYLSRNVKPPLTEQEVATRTGHEPMTVLISDIVLTATNGGVNATDEVGWNSHSPKDTIGGNIGYNDGHSKWKFIGQMKADEAATGKREHVTFTYSSPLVTLWW